MSKKAFKYRFYPSKSQEEFLNKTFGCVRLVYNMALNARKKAWEDHKKSVSYSDTSKMLTSWKKEDRYFFLNEPSSVALQQTLRNLDLAYKNFFAKRAGPPRFKSEKNKQSASFADNAFRLVGNKLILAKMKEHLDIKWSREIPVGAKATTVTVSKDRSGRWFVSILCELEIKELPKENTTVGIDLGLNHFAVLSNGEKVNNPRHFRKNQDKLAKAQRNLAKKKLGSKNRFKAKLKAAKVSNKIADSRKDFLHKLSTQLVRENQTIIVEDLAVKTMSAKGKTRRKTGLNKSILDASWFKFRTMLEYKCGWYGREFIKIDRFYPSSQLCSNCGVNGGKKPLNIRFWTCESCGSLHDRDINAAKNIKAAGLAASVCGGKTNLADVNAAGSLPVKQKNPI